MADQNGKKKGTGRRPLKYFYLNDELHKKLHINRGADHITTWCYPQRKRIAYTYTDVKRRMQPAYSTPEVAKMLNRSPQRIERALMRGDLEEPQFTYGLDENMNKYKYMWKEDDIMEVHRYFTTVHIGRPNAAGIAKPKRLPTPRELRAMIRQEEVMYVMRDGEFKPVWIAEDFD